ncbi:MAG: BMP family protein [Thermoleophilia bacterium]
MEVRTRLSYWGALSLLVALVLSLGIVMAACGGEEEPAEETETTEAAEADTTESTEAAEEPTSGDDLAELAGEAGIEKVAVVAPEEGTDYGWNQEGVQSTEALAGEIGAEVEVADGAGYEDVSPILRELAEGGADLLIAWASGYNTVAPQIAQETGVPTIVIGAFEQGLVPGLCQDLETQAEKGAYLAGYLAASMSKTGTVGIVLSADDENWTKMAGGFVAGAKYADEGIDIKMAQIGQAGYADAAGGKRVTESVISGGADVVFGMGDGSSFGMIQGVETATPPQGADKVWFIDVIGDKTELDEKGVILTSVVWDYLPLFKESVRRLADGTFGQEVLYLNLENDSIKLLQTEHIPADIWAEVEDVRQQIIAGEIEVPVLSSKSDVEQLIKQ